jgi:hypothetical protein
MGPSRKKRGDAADERRRLIADNTLIAEKWEQRADEAEGTAGEQEGGDR